MVKKLFCYCIFGVYFVTGTKHPDISQEGTSKIPKLIFYITTLHSLKDGQTQFLRLFFGTHIVSQVAVPDQGTSSITNLFIQLTMLELPQPLFSIESPKRYSDHISKKFEKYVSGRNIFLAAITQPCNATITQPCNATITQPRNATITQSCNATITQP
jgi:hypothetical protein